MADIKSAIIPLDGKNYPTWKIQCRMALMKDSLWGIVSGTETSPSEEQADARRKFVSRSDRALAIIVLAVDPSLLYLLGDPKDPRAVWQKLEEQFQRKTWSNKLQLRRKLYALKLKEGESINEHIKAMSEIFEALAAIGDAVSEEDRVVHLLASLPESYNVLVTALEAQSENVPRWDLVTERLLHQERKFKERVSTLNESDRKVLYAHQKKGTKKPFTCHYCHKPGHYKKDCRKYLASLRKQGANTTEKREPPSNDGEAFVTIHALAATSRGSWIVDSGATCHMCNDKNLFVDLRHLNTPQQVTLGDGSCLEGPAEGTVKLDSILPGGSTQRCTLENVLFVPKLSYSLLSVSKASEAGKTTKFNKSGCQILNKEKKSVASATRVGNLYYLKYHRKEQTLNVAEKSNEMLWHRRYGHLGEQNLKSLANDGLVKEFNYNASKNIDFCESCVGGKQHRTPFDNSERHTVDLLELVHSDVCGKISEPSIGGAQYFLTFTDDKSRYSWVYILKTKDQVFSYFLEWKALVEKATNKKIKTLRTDNGGEYTSTQLEAYLKAEGIRHELTVPKTPQQNGVAERLNRTLVETARSMLLDAKLPKRFWAEAISTAVYLKNRSPSKVTNMTPFEGWHGRKPKVNHFRVFGSDAYALIPKDERAKFDSKTRKCILLGYGSATKGYRLYDPTQRKIIHSRDVHFNETVKDCKQGKQDVTNNDYQLIAEFSKVTDHDSQSENDTTQCDDDQQPNPLNLRRSTRERKKPSFYGQECSNICEVPKSPMCYQEATAGPDKEKWETAMKTELTSLRENDVWDLVELPVGKKVVGCKWVYKVKTGADGSVQRYKARLVAQGFTQKYGTDFDETFCPVVRQESLRLLMALSVQHGLTVHQIDVTTAFLNGKLEEEVYMQQPNGFVCQGKEKHVCKLKKSIYGLKQSPRCWNLTLDAYLKKLKFVQTASDPCIYYRRAGGDIMYIGVYVDDIILAGGSVTQLEEIKRDLSQEFDIKDLGKLQYFLGMKVVQDEGSRSIWIGQPAYAENLLKKHGMQDSKPTGTPVDVNAKLQPATNQADPVKQTEYQSAVGSLMYLAVSTRPDIAFTVNILARFNSNPQKEHWTALKRVLRYLKGTLNHGILYKQDGSDKCIGYSDADWAGDTSDRKSTSGYIFMLSGGAISWSSRKQKCVALSTAEAEYVALSGAVQECIWLRQLEAELGSTSEGPTLILEDNQSAIAMAKNPQFHGRAKHIDIRHHFVREQVALGNIRLDYCSTTEMTADMLTKGLNCERYCKLREKAGICEIH